MTGKGMIGKKKWLSENSSDDRRVSVQVEVYFERNFHRHGMPVFHRWLEFPFLSGFDSLLVQSHSERIGHADVGGTRVGIHDEHERACPLIFRLALFLR